MKQWIKDTFGNEFKASNAHWAALVLAMVYLGLVVTQLFTYEKFDDVMSAYGLAGGEATTIILTVLIPLVESLALPYLLSMRLGSILRKLSLGAAVATPIIWLVLGVIVALFSTTVSNTGLLGATIPTVGGWSLALIALLMLASVGLVVRDLPERR